MSGSGLTFLGGALTPIFRKGRAYVFMVHSPGEVYLEGLVDMAARRGLTTIGIVHEDTLFPRASLGEPEIWPRSAVSGWSPSSAMPGGRPGSP